MKTGDGKPGLPEGEETGNGEVLEALPAGAEAPSATSADEAEKEVGSDFEKLKKELGVVNGRYLRLAADFDNYRKRQARERLEMAQFANESLVIDILPILDNLERALSAADGSKGLESVVKGVELTFRMFQGVLGKTGVERMKVLGEKFDPHFHEAVAQKVTDEVETETITDELEAGYTLNGRVVRPAKVRVARPSPSENGAKEETKEKEETDA